MTGNQKLFSSYKAYNGGDVIFSSNLRGNIIGKATISNDSLKIDNVERVDNLGFNLLSRGIRKKGLYVMKLGNKPNDQICLATIDKNSTLWHRRLGHANMRLIQSLASKELVRNLPNLKFDQYFCDACKMGKQAHASHKAKNIVSTTRCLELLLMDLFGPSVVRSYRGNRYNPVIVDDYSRCQLRTDHSREFDNEVQFGEFCNANDEEEAIKEIEKKNLENVVEDETLEIDEIVNIKESRNHPLENVIGNLNQRTLRSQAQNQSNFYYFISTIEPKNVNEALGDESWIVAMQEELNQFICYQRFGSENKLDENGIVSRNKARLVAQGYNQQEGIDYDETYAPVARLESIRILLAYACALDFKLFQMDVKSAFLNGFINEEVYVAQPPGFIDFEKPDHVYKLKKALYGLKQAPKAWYDRLKAFLIKHEYKIGMVDNTFFTKKKSSNLIIVQIYVGTGYSLKDKNEAKPDKIEHGMEKRRKDKCMSTRSSTRNLFPPLKDPKRTIRRRTRVDPNSLNDFKEINMAANGVGNDGPPPAGRDGLPVPDLRTMEELCQPTLNGRGGPIAPITIQATNFGLKNDMIQ
ncbi:retrovirus-related pol polyprotein from transposon TNT 1-94 [Tanacetum coccineum]